MTKKELQDHIEVVSQMEWDDLAISIIKMEQEIFELEEHMTKAELKKYHKLLKIYEKEKEKRVEDQSTGILNSGMMIGEDFNADWNIDQS